MNTLVFSSSQKLYDLDFYKGILRKTARKYDELTVRTDSGRGHAGELTEFCEALGWKVEIWKPNPQWPKFAGEIRNNGMISGYQYETAHQGQWADLVLCFYNGHSSDNTSDLFKKALAVATPLHLYREKWSRKKGKDDVFKGVVHLTNVHKPTDHRTGLQFGPEKWVYTPELERKAA